MRFEIKSKITKNGVKHNYIHDTLDNKEYPFYFPNKIVELLNKINDELDIAKYNEENMKKRYGIVDTHKMKLGKRVKDLEEVLMEVRKKNE